MEGYIDELYIYNKTFTEPELNALIKKCQGPQSTMILHLSFDKKSGTKFLDDSGLMNHASMGGPPVRPGQPAPALPPRKCSFKKEPLYGQWLYCDMVFARLWI